MELQTISVSRDIIHPNFTHWVIHKINSRWLLLLMPFQQRLTSLLLPCLCILLNKARTGYYFTSRSFSVDHLTIFHIDRIQSLTNWSCLWSILECELLSFLLSFFHSRLILATWQCMYYHLCAVARGVTNFSKLLINRWDQEDWKSLGLAAWDQLFPITDTSRAGRLQII